MNKDFADFEVSPEQRLADYQALSVYPDHSRPARPDAPEFRIAEWPGLQEKRRIDSAEILGWGAERPVRMQDGSLVAELRVRVAPGGDGRYSFFTVLQSPNGRLQLIQSDRTRDLEAGEHRIEFLFYGKIFHDLAAAGPAEAQRLIQDGGPYRLPGAFGERVLNEAEIAEMTANPDGFANPEGSLAPFYEAHRTERYALADFTEATWQSAEKQDRVDQLEAEIRAREKARLNQGQE